MRQECGQAYLRTQLVSVRVDSIRVMAWRRAPPSPDAIDQLLVDGVNAIESFVGSAVVVNVRLP